MKIIWSIFILLFIIGCKREETAEAEIATYQTIKKAWESVQTDSSLTENERWAIYVEELNKIDLDALSREFSEGLVEYREYAALFAKEKSSTNGDKDLNKKMEEAYMKMWNEIKDDDRTSRWW